MSELPAPTTLTRRDLLKLAAAGATLSGLPACTPDSSTTPALQAPEGLDDAAWAGVRAQFLIAPGTAYLNNASLGMPPRQVAEAVARGYRAISEERVHARLQHHRRA